MNALWITLFTLSLNSVFAGSGSVIGTVDTSWNLVKDHSIQVQRFDDPKVEGVSCYLSRARKGGVKGLVGLAEDPARMSIACRATGPVKVVGDIDESKSGEAVFSQKASAIFKHITVTRFFDKDKRTLVYLVWSSKLVDGSPFNNVTAVPLEH